MGDLLGYARVSTLEQNARLQTDALKAAGCLKVFTDKASGALDDRKELARLFDQVRPGDTVVVWRLDRRVPIRSALPAHPRPRRPRGARTRAMSGAI